MKEVQNLKNELNSEALVRSLKEALGNALVAVALYGSRTRGEGTAWSDWDVFIIAESLPEDKHDRGRLLSRNLLGPEIPNVSLFALTRHEFDSDLHPIYVDIAWDAIILFDTDGYLESKLNQVRAIADEKGIYRVKNHGEWVWAWKVWPEPGKWELRWRNP